MKRKQPVIVTPTDTRDSGKTATIEERDLGEASGGSDTEHRHWSDWSKWQ